MAEIKWDERLSVGVPELDRQHMHLIDLCRRAVAASRSGAADAVLRQMVAELRQYVKDHFQREEELMARLRYPGLGEHRAEHMKLTQTVKEFHYSGHKGQTVDAAALRALLSGWIIDHIIRFDLNYARFMKQATAGDNARADAQSGRAVTEPAGSGGGADG